jgi:hypothetical protein
MSPSPARLKRAAMAAAARPRPVFKLDTPVGLPTAATADLRAPVSSDCTANPFTADGTSYPGGAAGTAVALQTAADGRLRGDLFPPATPAPGPGQPPVVTPPAPGGGTPGPVHRGSHLIIGGGHSKRVSVRLTHRAIVRIHRAHRLAVRISAGGRSRAAIVRA